jgi:hypothetical protein
VRKADLEKIHERFESDLREMRERVLRLEELVKREATSRLVPEPKPQSDLSWLFEAGCVSLYARWLTFAQELMVGYLNRDASRVADALGFTQPRRSTKDMKGKQDMRGKRQEKTRHLPLAACEAILTWHRDFPTDPGHIKDLAKEILAIDPFGKLKDEDWKSLQEANAIRNAIVHSRSQRARKRYRELLNTRKGPGPFLRARADGQPRLVEYIERLIRGSKAMRQAYRRLESP